MSKLKQESGRLWFGTERQKAKIIMCIKGVNELFVRTSFRPLHGTTLLCAIGLRINFQRTERRRTKEIVFKVTESLTPLMRIYANGSNMGDSLCCIAHAAVFFFNKVTNVIRKRKSTMRDRNTATNE